MSHDGLFAVQCYSFWLGENGKCGNRTPKLFTYDTAQVAGKEHAARSKYGACHHSPRLVPERLVEQEIARMAYVPAPTVRPATKWESVFHIQVPSLAPIRRWMRDVWDRGFVHGSDLLEAIHAGGSGNAKNKAESFLRAAVGGGWVEKGKARGTVSQRANSDCTCPNGCAHAMCPGPQCTGCRHLDHYGYMPIRSCEEARLWLRTPDLALDALASVPTKVYEAWVDGRKVFGGERLAAIRAAHAEYDTAPIDAEIAVYGTDSSPTALTRFWCEGKLDSFGRWVES